MSAADPIYDVLGVGFGPANMALAALLEEAGAEGGGPELSRLFLEAKPGHAWHPNMLLEDSLIQITVLKDLAMVRNPRSRFTFLNYLHEKGRLFQFLNLRDLFPSRIEFNDYLSWVAELLAARVRYGRRVVAVEPEPAAGPAKVLRVTSEDAASGARETFRARNVVVATGGTPWTPPGISCGGSGRVFHTHSFLERLEQGYPDPDAPYRFVVVGSGQSGAELFYYLATRYRRAQVTAAIRRFSFKPVDESDFTNEIFLPEMVDFVYDLPQDQRRRVVDSFRDVNYAVVDAPLIRKIYRFLYDEKVRGRERARILPFLELTAAEEGPGEATLRFRHLLTGEGLSLPADGAVLATGYTWDRRHPLLEGLAPYFERDEAGGYRMERCYRVATRPELLAGVYLQGYAEDTHGISETVLSLLPVRAQNIFDALRKEALKPVAASG
jgi:L-ornithine N5-oxygenase